MERIHKAIFSICQAHPDLAKKYTEYYLNNRDDKEKSFGHVIAYRAYRRNRREAELLTIPRVVMTTHITKGGAQTYEVKVGGKLVAKRKSNRPYFATLIYRVGSEDWRGSGMFFGRPDLLIKSSDTDNVFIYGAEVAIACIDPTKLPGNPITLNK